VVTESALAGYSGTPLAKKLGIKPDFTVILVGAPQDFEKTVSGDLPEGVKFRRQARGRCDLIIWFCKSQKELKTRVKALGELSGAGGLWIAWPKQTSGIRTDLTRRRAGGLQDCRDRCHVVRAALRPAQIQVDTR
jgi:hypothetical protein